MGVEQKCKEYEYHFPNWERVRDVIAGEKRIHEKGTAYLPRPSGMDDPEWKCYIERAHFFGATGRTAEGLNGSVFQKAPILSDDAPDALKELLKNIDLSGRNLDQFASDCVWDSLPTNWGGILVDYPSAPEGIDLATAEKQGLRAYAAWYSAESIINWRYETRGNHQVLAFVVLHEPYERKVSGDEFATETKNKYRVLDFDQDGHYQVRIFDDAVENGLSSAVSTTIPKMNNAPLDYIPFFTFPGKNPDKSMLLDLANENIGHYQKTADYENGLHLTGIPTPFATCQAPVDEKGNTVTVKLGGNAFLWLNDPSATADYLDFKGEGLNAIQKAQQDCEERMAILGARIISAEKKGVESASAARIHRAGENSVLASFALNASDVFTKVIRLLAEWQNIAGCEKVTYTLNTDYNVEEIDAQLFSALVTARMNGKIPQSVFFWNLKEGEYIPPEMTLKEFEEELATEGDTAPGPNGDDQNAQNPDAGGTNDPNAKSGAVAK